MPTVRKDRVLAAATLALLLTTAGTAIAAPDNSITTGTIAQPSEADLNARIPLPEPADVPPPTAKDVGPVPVTTPAAAVAPAPTTNPAAAVAPAPATSPAVEKAESPAPAAQPAVTAAPQPATSETASAPAAEVPADPVAVKLKEIITTKLSRFVDRKDDRPGVESFYAARQYAPLWTDQGALNARGQAAIKYLAGVAVDGLDASDYPAPNFKAGTDPQTLAEAELKLVDSVLTFARHAAVGRVHFSRVSADIFYNQPAPEPAKVLEKLASAGDAGQALDSYLPQHHAYKALKAKLAELRGQTAEPAPAAAPVAPKVQIPEGRTLRPGDDDRRVALLHQRLEVGDRNSTRFDKALMEAVKEFQEKAGIEVDGSVGSETLRALNGGTRVAKPRGRNDTINVIIANLERWRWVPHDLGKSHVVLNIASQTLKVFNNGNKIWETRVVVGKPNTPTPLLTETMKYITVNPTWNVPPSIVYNEYLPALQQDPSAMARIGIKVVQNNDGSLHMYQPPGDGNALGRIRFNFPNKFLVYQHDTPDKHLFARETRAYSHGCMRVQDPLKYGEVILSIARPNERYTVEKLRSMYGPEEREITLPTPIPVHITYQTAYVDESGKLVIRDDIYKRDAQTLAVLHGDRQVADVPMDRRAEQQVSYNRGPVSLPYGVVNEGSTSSRYAYRNEGGNFFEMLFGGPRYYQQQPAPRPSGQVGRRSSNSGASRPLN
jgi:murein L,D-transpeptidase YcbB/YkuD